MLKKLKKIVDATYAGACLLTLFIKYPWLSTVDLYLTAESQSDDQGATFRSISGSFESVTLVEGFELPSDVANDKGELDESTAIDVLDEEVSESDLASDVYTSLYEAWDYDDIKISLDRSKVADLLESSTMSGRQAFKALLSEHCRHL